MDDPNADSPYLPLQSRDRAADSSGDPFVQDGMTGKLIVLSTFNNSADAHLFKNELENNGIKASVNNESSTAIFGATIAGPSSAFWIEVLVMETDVEQAMEVKNAWNQEAETLDTEVVPEWVCQCGETVDEGFAICWNCGAEFQQD